MQKSSPENLFQSCNFFDSRLTQSARRLVNPWIRGSPLWAFYIRPPEELQCDLAYLCIFILVGLLTGV